MKNLTSKFKFTVPSDSPVVEARGTKIEKEFSYQQVENDTDVNQVLKDKQWTVADLINEALKANARSNAYQNALAPHKPSEVSADDIKERMVRDYMRLGVPENIARAQVESLLSAQATNQ